MVKNYFTLDENFEEIIKDALKDKEIISITPIPTGWTNIVFETSTNTRKLFFPFSKRRILV